MTAPSEAALKAAAHVDEARLWARHMEMAKLGARADGGVNRQTLSETDRAARELISSWARERGYTLFIDDMANQFIRREGTGDGPAVLAGSHMDSQPAGGRFDGIYGVLAAFEALDALDAAGLKTGRAIECVNWTNEEGSRYLPGAMGSMVWSGKGQPQDFFGLTDKAGARFEDELAATITAATDAEKRPLGFNPHAYLEAHIEQGPVLEERGLDVAAVSGIQGWRWLKAEVTGVSGHAGTVPMAQRIDALQAATRAIAALGELMQDRDDVVRFTVGHMEVEPNSPNTIPSTVRFTIDFRHPDQKVLAERGGRIEQVVRAAVSPCEVTLTETTRSEPNDFPADMVARIEGAAEALGVSHTRLASGAYHDAHFVARVCPTAMIFVPCRGGISHHPDEYAEAHHLAAGARVLTAALADLAGVS